MITLHTLSIRNSNVHITVCTVSAYLIAVGIFCIFALKFGCLMYITNTDVFLCYIHGTTAHHHNAISTVNYYCTVIASIEP